MKGNTDSKEDEVVSDQIDQLLSGSLTKDDDMSEIQGFLIKVSESTPKPTLEFQNQLKDQVSQALAHKKNQQKLNSGTKHWHNTPSVRRALGAAAMITVSLLVMMTAFYAPARAFATDQINELLKLFGLVQTQPTLPVPVVVVITPPSESATGTQKCVKFGEFERCGPNEWMTKEDAIKRAGFAILAPTYLTAGYMPMDQSFEIDTQTKTVRATASKIKHQIDCTADIVLTQMPVTVAAKSEYPIGTASSRTTSVSGSTALWIENIQSGNCVVAQPDQPSQTQVVYTNLLAWGRNGINYRLSVNADVSLDEARKIAESLQ